MPKFDIVDSQVHLFHKMNPDQCLFAMDSLGVKSLLIDEVWGFDVATSSAPPFQELANGVHRPLTDGARMASMQHPSRFKYLRRVDHRDPDLATIVRQCAEDPHCLALRAEIWARDVDDLSAGRYGPLFHEAARWGLPVFALTTGRSAELGPYIAEIGDCRFVLDHLGLVKTQEAWEGVLRLARHPNLSLKWCHANPAFPPGDYPYRGLQAELRRAVDAFGPERVMWASDVTMLRPEITWADSLFYVRECGLLSEEERAWVLGRCARRTLAWPPD